MLKEALQYLVGLKSNNVYEIDGKTFSDNKLEQITGLHHYPATVHVESLDAIVKLVRTEFTGDNADENRLPVYIHIEGPTGVEVFTRLDALALRSTPYEAVCRDVNFKEGWRDQQSAIIELRSRFIPTVDSAYLLDLISRINNEEGVQSNDNGVSQTVTAKKGVSLMTTEQVKPRIKLQPFRTFREVEQPESEFILRLDDSGRIGLFEADGGIWKIEAKENIKAYFSRELAEEIKCGAVVVMI